MYTDQVPQKEIEIKNIKAKKIILQPGDATRYEFLVSLNPSVGWPLVEIALLNFSGGGFALSFDSRFLLSAWADLKALPLHKQVAQAMTGFVRDSMPEHCNNLYTARALVQASALFLEELGISDAGDLKNYSTPLGGDM